MLKYLLQYLYYTVPTAYYPYSTTYSTTYYLLPTKVPTTFYSTGTTTVPTTCYSTYSTTRGYYLLLYLLRVQYLLPTTYSYFSTYSTVLILAVQYEYRTSVLNGCGSSINAWLVQYEYRTRTALVCCILRVLYRYSRYRTYSYSYRPVVQMPFLQVPVPVLVLYEYRPLSA